jgi:hypothetical protein
MATNLVQPLDQSQAQLYCPMCDANGTPNVPLVRELHVCKCPFSHQYSSVGEAIARGAKMIPMPLNEQPPLTSIKMNVWVHPKVKELLEQRYRGRLIVTLDSVLGSLADGNVLIVTGADVDKIKKRGASNGAQIVSLLETTDNIATENAQLRSTIEKYENVFRSAGIGAQ